MDPERCDGGAGETGRRCTRHDPLRTADQGEELVAVVAITVGTLTTGTATNVIFPTGAATWPICARIDAAIADRMRPATVPTASPITAPIPMSETNALSSWIERPTEIHNTNRPPKHEQTTDDGARGAYLGGCRAAGTRRPTWDVASLRYRRDAVPQRADALGGKHHFGARPDLAGRLTERVQRERVAAAERRDPRRF